MTSNLVIEEFKKLFPYEYTRNVAEYFPNGSNSIRLVKNDGGSYVFTYYSENNFILESLESYIDNLSKELNHIGE